MKPAMKVEYVIGSGGDKGSFQGEWPEQCECTHCGKKAILVFTTAEDSGLDQYLCDLNVNIPSYQSTIRNGDEYWFHDATSWAVYICRGCFEATAKWNQA